MEILGAYPSCMHDDLLMQVANWKEKSWTKHCYQGGLGSLPQEILKFNASTNAFWGIWMASEKETKAFKIVRYFTSKVTVIHGYHSAMLCMVLFKNEETPWRNMLLVSWYPSDDVKKLLNILPCGWLVICTSIMCSRIHFLPKVQPVK